MSSSKPDHNRLDRLRLRYRATFREWISARNLLGATGRGADAEAEAQAHEVAASLEYGTARNQLTDAMSGRSERGSIAAEKGRGPSPNARRPSAHALEAESRVWFRDFALALLLIALGIAGGTLLSLVDFSVGRGAR